MAADSGPGRAALAACAGFAVIADDGVVGEVETPLFAPDRGDPDYLVVRVGCRFPLVPAAIVADVDPERCVVRVRGDRDRIGGFPERLPLAP